MSRDSVIQVRVSAEERARLESRAGGKGLSTWLRELGLGAGGGPGLSSGPAHAKPKRGVGGAVSVERPDSSGGLRSAGVATPAAPRAPKPTDPNNTPYSCPFEDFSSSSPAAICPVHGRKVR